MSKLTSVFQKEHNKIVYFLIEQAKEDPERVKNAIDELREAGEINDDDLRYLERIISEALEQK